MSDDPKPSGEGGWSWKRAADYLKAILNLERAVRELQAENKELRRHVDRLKQTVDDHNGQLKVILSLMGSTLDNRVEATAEKAAVDAVVRLIGNAESGEPALRRPTETEGSD